MKNAATFKTVSRISVADVRKAILNNGDVAVFSSVLKEALGNPPVDIIESFYEPIPLPDANVLLNTNGMGLANILNTWNGKFEYPDFNWDMDISLLPVPPYGRNVSVTIARIIDGFKPDIMVLDEPVEPFRADLLYSFSLTAAAGMTMYTDMGERESRKFYGRRIYYPGSMTETAIIKSWLNKIPLIPAGRPYPPGHPSMVLPDEETSDEELSGINLKDAYQALDAELVNKSDLDALIEATEPICQRLEVSVSPRLNRKFSREAAYLASRLMDIGAFIPGSGKPRILVILDMKHYLGMKQALGLLLAQLIEGKYSYTKHYPVGKLSIGGRYPIELDEEARQNIPGTTLIQEIFTGALDKWATQRATENIPEDLVDKYIARICQRTRHHLRIAHGASVRGSLALKEVLSGFGAMSGNISRENMEKAAMISLLPRIALKPGIRESRASIIQEIARSVLYDFDYYQKLMLLGSDRESQWLSQEELDKILEKLSKGEADKEDAAPQEINGIAVIADKNTDERLLKALMDNKLLRKDSNSNYFLTSKSVERLLKNLEEKLKDNQITTEDYEQERARLLKMMPTENEGEPLSKEDTAAYILDFMDSLDSQIPADGGNDLNYLRMLDYYQRKNEIATPGSRLRHGDFYALKCAINDMLRRGILEKDDNGEHLLTSAALSFLVDYVAPRNTDLRQLADSVAASYKRVNQRKMDIVRFSRGNTYQDISFRHTLKQVARQRKPLTDIAGRDLRVFWRRRERLKSDIVICIDRSGSMADNRKMAYARLAAATITDAAIKNGDRVGLVGFEDLGQISLPLTKGNTSVLEEYITNLKPSGATNIGDGIKCAAELLLAEATRNKKRIILITDGEPNAVSEKTFTSLKKKVKGDLSVESALVETRHAASRGIRLTVIFMDDGKKTGIKFAQKLVVTGRGGILIVTCPQY